MTDFEKDLGGRTDVRWRRMRRKEKGRAVGSVCVCVHVCARAEMTTMDGGGPRTRGYQGAGGGYEI